LALAEGDKRIYVEKTVKKAGIPNMGTVVMPGALGITTRIPMVAGLYETRRISGIARD